MIPYLIVFFLSVFFSYLALKQKKHNLYILFSVFSVLSLGILAGLRGPHIGRDVEIYGDRLFYMSKQMSYLSFVLYGATEPLFYTIVYLVSNIFNSIVIYYTVLQLLVISPIYIAISDYNKKFLPIGIFVYDMMLYSHSLNIMRQAIAIGFVLYAFKYIRDKKLLKYSIWCIVSSLFHSSALIMIIVYPLYQWINKYEYKNPLSSVNGFGLKSLKKWSLVSMVIIFMVIIVANWAIFLNAFINLGLVNNTYAEYLYDIESFSFETRYLLYFCILIIIYIFFGDKKDNEHTFLLLMLILTLVFYELRGYSGFGGYAFRIGCYFNAFACISLPKLMFSSKKETNKIFVRMIVLITLICYWHYFFVETGNCQIYPYVFR